MTKPSSNVSQAFRFRYLRMPLILKKFPIALFVTMAMCCLKLSVASSPPPKYLTYVLISMRLLSSLMDFVLHLASCCLDPNEISSVLSQFSFKRMEDIHSAILCTDCCRSLTVLSSSSLTPGLNERFNEWSSAKPLSSTGLLLSI